MATYITEDGSVYYENVPEEKRTLFPNIPMIKTPEGYDNLVESIAEAYDDTKTYSVGDYVLYDSRLYVCITNIETAEVFDNEKWEETEIGNKLTDLKSQIANIYIVSGALSAVSGETNINAAKRAYNAGLLPTGRPFIGVFVAGSYRFISGYLYLSGDDLYGCGFCGTYNINTLFTVNGGVWASQTSLSS